MGGGCGSVRQISPAWAVISSNRLAATMISSLCMRSPAYHTAAGSPYRRRTFASLAAGILGRIEPSWIMLVRETHVDRYRPLVGPRVALPSTRHGPWRHLGHRRCEL